MIFELLVMLFTVVIDFLALLLGLLVEFVAPATLFGFEVLFWLVLIVADLLVALFTRKKFSMRSKPVFSNARKLTTGFSERLKQKQALKLAKKNQKRG